LGRDVTVERFDETFVARAVDIDAGSGLILDRDGTTLVLERGRHGAREASPVSAVRVLVTEPLGQVGHDLLDTLRGWDPPGSGIEPGQPDGRRVGDDEFDVVGASHHELDVADAESVSRVLDAVPTPNIWSTWRRGRRSTWLADHVAEA
jgi:hypothetical protein